MKNRSLLVIGGVAASKAMVLALAELLGSALEYDQVAGLSFREARRPARLVPLIEQADIILTSSAGIIRVYQPGISLSGKTVIHVSPPEPRGVGQLVRAALIDQVRQEHDSDAITSGSFSTFLRTLLDGTEIFKVSKFSTNTATQSMEGVNVSLVLYEGDSFFPLTLHDTDGYKDDGVEVALLPGEHSSTYDHPSRLAVGLKELLQ